MSKLQPAPRPLVDDNLKYDVNVRQFRMTCTTEARIANQAKLIWMANQCHLPSPQHVQPMLLAIAPRGAHSRTVPVTAMATNPKSMTKETVRLN